MKFEIGADVELTESGATIAQQSGLPFADDGGMTSDEWQASFEVVGVDGKHYVVRSVRTGREGRVAQDLLKRSGLRRI